jgi:hypothetical protein
MTSPRQWVSGRRFAPWSEIVAVVDRPKDIEDEDAMGFFGGLGVGG